MGKMKLIRLQCKRCGHEWIPRQDEVRMCPKCKSIWYDKPRKVIKVEKDK